MIKIAPSILAADFSRLGDEIEKIDKAGADMVHIDVMDGHFVPNITIGPQVVKSLRNKTTLPFDVHLMIQKPDMYLDSFIEAGADTITVHVENCLHLNRVIQRIKERGKKAAVALNPSTSLASLDWVLNDSIDMVLLMTVNPGFGGQVFIKDMIEKTRELKKLIGSKGLSTDIQVDGGIDLQNIGSITEAGANVIVSGTSIFKSDDTGKVIKEFRERAWQQYQ